MNKQIGIKYTSTRICKLCAKTVLRLLLRLLNPSFSANWRKATASAHLGIVFTAVSQQLLGFPAKKAKGMHQLDQPVVRGNSFHSHTSSAAIVKERKIERKEITTKENKK